MFARIKDALRRFFSGRYGSDNLNRALLLLSVVLLIVGWVGTGLLRAEWMSLFNLLAYAPLIYCIFRMLSRNFTARHRENAAYLRLTAPIRDRKNRYFKCPDCGQTVRVPRGKGTISIRCPKCSCRFVKKT